MKQVVTEDLLSAIIDPFEYSHVIHGTYRNVVPTILKSGLNKMARNNIHMATGMPGNGVISGMRASCQVVIEVNIVRAFMHKIPFFVSTNKVILSSGIDDIIPAKFFRSIVDHKKQEFMQMTDIDYICVLEEKKVSVIDAELKQVVNVFEINLDEVDKALTMIHEKLDAIFKSEFVFLAFDDSIFENLKKQAVQKKLKVPNYLKRWINMSKVYQKTASDFKHCDAIYRCEE